MYEPLVPCTACRRHIRAVDSACPFCDVARRAEVLADAPVPRMSRAAMVAFAASLAVAGCRSEPEPVAHDPAATKPAPSPSEPLPKPLPSPSTYGDNSGAVAGAYGGPPLPSPSPMLKPSAVTTSTKPLVHDHGAARPKYGAPPRPEDEMPR